MNVGEAAFRFGRRIGKHKLAGWLFCLTERALPVRRLARKHGLVAFHHPRPVADPHVLIVPTRPVSSMTTHRLSDEAKASLLWNMVELAQDLTPRLPAHECWQLVINGGTRQDIGQLHGHLLHATGESDQNHREILEPASNLVVWQDIFDELRQAEQVPSSGFSLIFRWKSGGSITAMVTRSG